MKQPSRKEDITDDEVEQIKRIYRTTHIHQRVLAEMYGVSQAYISAIILNKCRVVPTVYGYKELSKEFPLYADKIANIAKNTERLIEKRIGRRVIYKREEVKHLAMLLDMVNRGELINAFEAGRILNLTHQRVSQYQKDKKFTLITIGAREYMYRSEIEAFAKARTKHSRNVFIAKVENPVESFSY